LKRLFSTYALVVSIAALCPSLALAQDATLQALADVPAPSIAANDQAPAQGVQNAVTDVVKKWNIGVQGGIALDPEMITFGAFGSFGPIFSPAVRFRPGVYLSFGEVTTEFGVDLDVLYTIPGSGNAWRTYVGGGPNFALSHRGFTAETETDTPTPTPTDSNTTTTTTSRFDFGDTDFDAGFNFIVGASKGKGFFEMKATAYGVSNVKLLAGFRF
jgi:hypothetical protein